MSLAVLHVIHGTYSLHKGTSRRSTLSEHRRASCFGSFKCCPASPSNRGMACDALFLVMSPAGDYDDPLIIAGVPSCRVD